ncbi:hypothetical protein EUX98_g907 [Antrodiella citrinella]|uniref:Uncharacterized protein n=1 Tax=Antrodiella citrinella TaxID=2447956 RepID=A0A4S4N2T2_9APHY|nr:hypothetical protein EUX98_g907 [Antrodiella citrinella]
MCFSVFTFLLMVTAASSVAAAPAPRIDIGALRQAAEFQNFNNFNGGSAQSGSSGNTEGGDVINEATGEGEIDNECGSNTAGNGGSSTSGDAIGGDGPGGGNARSGNSGDARGGSVINSASG